MTSAVSYALAFEQDLRAADLSSRRNERPVQTPWTVAAVVRQFGEAEEREDGLTLYRLTTTQLADRDINAMLGADQERARDISVLWDDREEELVEVIDQAAIRPTTPMLSYAELKVRSDRRLRYPRYARAA